MALLKRLRSGRRSEEPAHAVAVATPVARDEESADEADTRPEGEPSSKRRLRPGRQLRKVARKTSSVGSWLRHHVPAPPARRRSAGKQAPASSESSESTSQDTFDGDATAEEGAAEDASVRLGWYIRKLERDLGIEPGESPLVEKSDRFLLADSFELGDDPRYTLTEQERAEVVALKRACDGHNVAYESIFELAKFAMVVSSLPASDRLIAGFGRIMFRREFEQEHGIASISHQDIVSYFVDVVPGWALPGGKTRDGLQILSFDNVALTEDNSWAADKTLVYAALFELSSLAAVDLEEARRGFVNIHNVWGLGLLRGGKIASLLYNNFRDFGTSPMHTSRVKRNYIAMPMILNGIVNLFLRTQPQVIHDRTIAARHIPTKGPNGIDKDQLAPALGGTLAEGFPEYMQRRKRAFDESTRRVQL